MSFLRCTPSVFVIGEEYEILCLLSAPGLFSVRVGNETYYENNTGVLPTERTVAKVRVPMAALNEAKRYEIVFRREIDRKAYFSLFEDEETLGFDFSPIPAEGEVNIYFTADIHGCFEIAERTVSYFGDALHLLIVAGDLAEVQTEEDYELVAAFLGRVAGGRLPVLMVRGNHDTRGHLAELFPKYFPTVGYDTYYPFDLGRFAGVVLDCGEDKPDDYLHYGAGHNGDPVYNGTNIFERFRRRETRFLKALDLPKDRPLIAVSHICPALTTVKKGDVFDIDREVYTEWNRELERLGIDVMLTGHLHRAFLIEPGDERATAPHSYPALVASEFHAYKIIYGTAITLTDAGMTYRFTGEEHEVIDEGYIPFH